RAWWAPAPGRWPRVRRTERPRPRSRERPTRFAESSTTSPAATAATTATATAAGPAAASASTTTGCSSRAVEAPAAGVATIAEALRVPPTTEAVERAGLATLEPTGLPDAAGAGRRRLHAAISEAACGLLADRALLRSTSLLTEPALLADRTLAGACTLLTESALLPQSALRRA